MVAQEQTAVETGAFALQWPASMLTGVGYQVQLFANGDGDAVCDPQVDAAWGVDIDPATGDTEVTTVPPLDSDSSVCDAFFV